MARARRQILELRCRFALVGGSEIGLFLLLLARFKYAPARLRSSEIPALLHILLPVGFRAFSSAASACALLALSHAARDGRAVPILNALVFVSARSSGAPLGGLFGVEVRAIAARYRSFSA